MSSIAREIVRIDTLFSNLESLLTFNRKRIFTVAVYGRVAEGFYYYRVAITTSFHT